MLINGFDLRIASFIGSGINGNQDYQFPRMVYRLIIASFIGSGINGNVNGSNNSSGVRDAKIASFIGSGINGNSKPINGVLSACERRIASFIGSGINGNLNLDCHNRSRGASRSLLL